MATLNVIRHAHCEIRHPSGRSLAPSSTARAAGWPRSAHFSARGTGVRRGTQSGLPTDGLVFGSFFEQGPNVGKTANLVKNLLCSHRGERFHVT